MIQITTTIALDDRELHFDYIHASGPGGQNVNKVSSAVQLRFDVLDSPSLPDAVRQRLIKLAGKRINSEGILVITAKRYRTQLKNREDALQRLSALVLRATEKPKVRRKTKPTPGARKQRLDAKKRRAHQKSLRKPVLRTE